MNRRHLFSLAAFAALTAGISVPQAGASSAFWGGGTGNYSSTTNWYTSAAGTTLSAPPGSTTTTNTDTATFNTTAGNSTATLLTVDTTEYIGNLTFNNTAATTIQGNSTTLNFGRSAGTDNLTIASGAGAVTIGGGSLTFVLAGNMNVNNNSATPLTISAPTSGNTIFALVGEVDFSAAETSVLKVQGGTVKLLSGGSTTTTTYVNGGTFNLNGFTATIAGNTGASFGATGAVTSTINVGAGGTLTLTNLFNAQALSGNTVVGGGGFISGGSISLPTGTGFTSPHIFTVGQGTQGGADLTISSAFTGAGALTFTSGTSTVGTTAFTGNTVLTGASTHTGGTNVLAGTLTLGSTSALAGATGTLTVGGSTGTINTVATTFSGILTSTVANTSIGSTLTMTASVTGATPSISPNGTGIGALTLTPTTGTTLTTTAGTLFLNIATNGASSDQIIGSGTAKFSLSNTTLDLGLGTANNAAVYGNSYTLLSGFTGTNTISGLTIDDYDTTDYTASLSTLGVLSFTAVPEPATWASGALAMAACIGSGLRRRARSQKA